MDAKIKLPSAVVASGSIHALRTAAGMIGSDQAKTLLEAVRAGSVVDLEVEATTFIQRKTPNRNFTRFKPSILGDLAKSYVGLPFQRDHSTAVGDRGGTVKSSQLLELAAGGACFNMTLALTKPWAVEGVLDGTIDRFSIAWNPTGDIECSVCGEAMANYCGWVFSNCEHEPGETYSLEDDEDSVVEKPIPQGPDRDALGMGGGRVCELVYTAAEGTEVSAVSVPAVKGTEIEAVRESLALARASVRGQARPAGRPAASWSKAQIDALKAEGNKAIAIDRLVHRAAQEGRMASSEAIAKLAEADLEAATAWVNELPMRHVPAAKPTAAKIDAHGLNRAERKAAKSVGVTPAAFAAEKRAMLSDFEGWEVQRLAVGEELRKVAAELKLPVASSLAVVLKEIKNQRERNFGDSMQRSANESRLDRLERQAHVTTKAVRITAADCEGMSEGEIHVCRQGRQDPAAFMQHKTEILVHETRRTAIVEHGLNKSELATCRQLGLRPADFLETKRRMGIR